MYIIYLLACPCAALATASMLSLFTTSSTSAGNRITSIDGLRGFAGFFVFIQHASIWPNYASTGIWNSQAAIAGNFGGVGVLTFFMITAFLFTTKVLESEDQNFNSLRFFVGRVLRLCPLYFSSIIVLGLLISIASDFQLKEDLIILIKNILFWIIFTVADPRVLNKVPETGVMMAGVTWTLPYEWLFYFTLPVLAIALGKKANFAAAAISTIFAIAVLYFNHLPFCLLAFGSGSLAAYCARKSSWQNFSRKKIGAVLALGCISITTFGTATAYSAVGLASLTFAFILIASGGSLFGLLTLRSSRLLGECSYGIYLLHGFLLYITYRFLIGSHPDVLTGSSNAPLIALTLTPILVLVSHGAFVIIERPSLSAVKPVTIKLAQFLKFLRDNGYSATTR